MGFLDVINAKLDLPQVKGNSQIKLVLERLGYKELDYIRANGSISIKKLILISELALTGKEGSFGERFDKFFKLNSTL